MARLRHSTNIIFSKEEHEQLKAYAAKNHQSVGALIRTLFRHAYYMDEHGKPVCANGTKCFVPHLHPTPTPPTPLNPEA